MIQKTAEKKKPVALGLLYVCTLITMASAAIVRAQEPELVDRIVAVVNSDIITLYDLNRALKPYEENIKALRYDAEKERETLFQVRRDLLSQLIDRKLADQEIERAQITVNEREIDKTIERVKESRNFTDERLREGLAQQGLTMEEYRNELKEQILRTKLVNREVKSKIVVTKEDIKAYYDNHQSQYAGEKKYYLFNMFVKLSSFADETEKEEARRKLEAVLAKLKQGIAFEELWRRLKESPTGVEGTDLGLYQLDELSVQLREVVEKMQSGEFSEVVNTDFGPQIIYVQKIQEKMAKSLDEIESEIQEKLYNEAVDNKYQEWLDALRKRSLIKIIS